MSILNTGLATPASGYDIANSLRFNDNDSAYLSRTPSAGNRRTWTFSCWVKLGNLTFDRNLFSAGNGTYDSRTEVLLDSNNKLAFTTDNRAGGGTYNRLKSGDTVFRDPSAWYHILFAVDTTQATASNRIKMYVNGSQLTVTEVYSPPNGFPARYLDTFVNSTSNHYVSKTNHHTSPNQYLDGYLADVHFIDGSALEPTDFGEFDETYGHWKAKEYTGSYGNNGFYLDFKLSADSASGLGNDASSNSNNWTPNNLDTYDQMLDSPTNNFATWNPLRARTSQPSSTFSEGNLKASGASTHSYGTAFTQSGKWYFEILVQSQGRMSQHRHRLCA